MSAAKRASPASPQNSPEPPPTAEQEKAEAKGTPETAAGRLENDGTGVYVPDVDGMSVGIPSIPSPPVQWYLLIRAMEAYRLHTGMGLAETWRLVHDGDYDAASASFQQTVSGEDTLLDGAT